MPLKTVAITGGANGIGFALAIRLLQCGMRIILLDKDEVRLQELRSQFPDEQMMVYSLDITDTEQCMNALEMAQHQLGSCDVLINSAGILQTGSLLRGETNDSVFQTNFFAVVNFNKIWWQLLQQSASPHIITISSVFAVYAPYPFGMYSASKSALLAYTRALHQELIQYNGNASAVVVGFTETDMFREQQKTSNFRLANHYAVTADDVAQCIIRLMTHPQQEAYVTLLDQILVNIVRIYPSAIRWMIE